MKNQNQMDIKKIIYWVATVAMCGVFAFSAQMYFRNTEMVQGFFTHLGYPSYIVIPLAILKVLGIVAVLTRKSKMLTEWAYFGFLLDAILAFTAHQVAEDGGAMFSIIAIVSTIVSRIMYGMIYHD